MSAVMESSSVQMDAESAQKLTDRIRTTLRFADDLLTEAYESKAWMALGYVTWELYCKKEFEGLRRIRLSKEERQALFTNLHEKGMSKRSMAKSFGVSEDTVRRSLPQVPEATEKPVEETVLMERPSNADRALAALSRAGYWGMTWKELCKEEGWHHGQSSAALSELHRKRKLLKLTERRDGDGVYVQPEAVEGRETVAHRRWK